VTVDEVEARRVLDKRVAELRQHSYLDLKASWFGQPDCEQIKGPSGAEYQVEIGALWDDRPKQTLRIVVSVDDGRGWRAFSPLADSFIVAPDGSFVGE
jgi:hypothetical protein